MIIPDDKIHMFWRVDDKCLKSCASFGTETEVEANLDSIQDSGIPICPVCGDEMIYDRTEIDVVEVVYEGDECDTLIGDRTSL